MKGLQYIITYYDKDSTKLREDDVESNLRDSIQTGNDLLESDPDTDSFTIDRRVYDSSY